MKSFTIIAATLGLLAATCAAESYDLILRNGRVADGTGNPTYMADIAIKDGRITAIGRVPGRAEAEIDARNLVVAPGFIDVHTHADGVAGSSRAENFVRMGVTTIVVGNCGSSRLGIADLFQDIEKRGVSVNVASLIGHGSVRGKVMGGSFMRPPTADELEQMKGLVRQAMEDGAVGMSTGLIYLPGTFAKTEEIIELAKVVSEYDGIYASHMRGEGNGIFKSLEELFRIAQEANVRAEISHIKLSGNSVWGRASEVLAAIERARAGGLDITQDQYAYTASSTSISSTVPSSAREGGTRKLEERLNDPEQKARIVAEMKRNLRESNRDSFAYAVIASYRADRSLNGLSIPEAAKRKRGSDSLDDQIEMIFEILRTGGASGVFHSMSEEDLQTFMRHPNTMVACDSGNRDFGSGMPHPRGYGNNARVLGRYVRELNVLRLEDAIRRMTSLPATTFRLPERGQIAPGNWADIVVFDPATVRDLAAFNDPHHYSVGFRYVLVNGTVVVKDDQHTGAKPGKPLRHGGTRAVAAN